MYVVNNFYKGVLKRGIPIYTSELVSKLRGEGIEVKEITCPRWARRISPSLQNILFVFYEQILIPMIRIVNRSQIAVYPYNSVSLIDLFLGKSLLIVHDFISLNDENRKLSALYVRSCLKISSDIADKVIFISESTQSDSKRLRMFCNAEQYILPNSFFAFESLIGGIGKSDVDNNGDEYILIVSGKGANKDFSGCLANLVASGAYKNYRFKVIGFGNDSDIALEIIQDVIPKCSVSRFEVIGFVSLHEIVKLYSKCCFVYAHSLAEGYGRAIAEAKIAGKKVICTSIPSFLEQDDELVFYYEDSISFKAALNKLLNAESPIQKQRCRENVVYEDTLRRIIDVIQ